MKEKSIFELLHAEDSDDKMIRPPKVSDIDDHFASEAKEDLTLLIVLIVVFGAFILGVMFGDQIDQYMKQLLLNLFNK